MDLEKLMAMGTQLGLSGQELRAWIESERAEQRAARAAEREASRETAERAKEAAERAKDAAEREKELLLLRIRLQESGGTSQPNVAAGGEVVATPPAINPQKLLPLFDEKRDDLHAYLQRFERVATGQQWPQDKWALAVSMCLSGEALTIIGRMTAEESLDYVKVKRALLQRFRFTAQGYQEKFRKARAEDGETGKQLAARLTGYFDHWIEMANVQKTFEALRDQMIGEQFIRCCHPKLVIFLKERECKTLNDLAETTDRFIEAQNLSNLGKFSGDDRDTDKVAADSRKKVPPKCFVCNRPGHQAQDCRNTPKDPAKCTTCGRLGHKTENCRNRPNGKEQVAACAVTEPPRAPQKCTEIDGDKQRGPGVESPRGIAVQPSAFLVKRMPVVEGRLLGQPVTVLRDTGSNTVIVRRDLVAERHLTGKTTRVLLIDGTVKQLAEAKIYVETPYFVGESQKGNRYVLTLIDFATRYPDAVALPAIDSAHVAEALIEIFSRIGIPKEIVTDQGLEKAREKQKSYYDRKSRPRKLSVGNKVLILLPTDSNKLLMQWKGPFEVTEKKNDVDYEISLGGKRKVFHINMLKLYEERQPSPPPQASVVTTIDDATDTTDEPIDDEPLVDILPTLPLRQTQSWRDVKYSPDLGEDQRAQVQEIIHEYSLIFSDLPGKTDLVQCPLNLTSDKPVHVPQYPLPLALHETIENEVQEMLDMGIIEKSQSPYNAPMVAIKKPDGTLRLCIDFRELNKVLVSDCEPIPRIDVVLALAGKKKFFSKFDFTKGYWQVPMTADSREKTAFSSLSGLYHFRYMPFGIKTAPAVFARLMRAVLGGLKNVHHYFDDVIVATDTWQEHLETLRQVFERIKTAKLTIKPSKREIGERTISFLGHHIGESKV
ncbi:uncharacterized protein LOC144143244 [Haemaphysalis longicornis]